MNINNSPKYAKRIESISGSYYKTIFRNEENGFTIFEFKLAQYGTKDIQQIVKCKGICPVYSKCMPLKLTGYWELSKYGFTFVIKHLEEYVDDNEISINYLSTDLCKGIGKKVAENIVNTFGPNIFEFINKSNAVNLLKDNIKTMTIEKAENLIFSIKNTIVQREVFEYIAKFGGSYISAMKIISEYNIYSLERLKDNPYKVGRFAGINFYICDSIARKCGIDYLDRRRISALISEAMSEISSNGNTYTTQDELLSIIKRIIKSSAYPLQINSAIILNILTQLNWIVIEKDINKSRIFTLDYWKAERATVHEIRRLNTSSPLPYKDSIIDFVENKLNIKYESKQKEAFNILKTNGIKIITGGPGTGKTTTINGIIEAYKILNPNKIVTLCAPTGRAAQRLKESTNHEAFTIHKLLNYKPFGTEITHKDDKDPIDSDFIIVDEFSMMDIKLMSIFLNAIKTNTLICFVGDPAQLPSVDAGNVMHDIINADILEIHKLEAIFRQSETSNIVVNAEKIRNNDVLLQTGDDFEIYRFDTDTELIHKLKEISTEFHCKNNFDVQVLSPVKKNLIGINNINVDLQNLINKNHSSMFFGNNEFKVNDKIIMTQNNYSAGYYNGDIGIIKQINKNSMLLLINDEEIELARKNYMDISLAYAITIHKSQGSEFPIIIICLPKRPTNMLERNLIFTAVTRAKNKVIILSERNALEIAIKKNNLAYRRTRLYERLIGEKIDIVQQRLSMNTHLL